jgi:hypothetical protein
MNKFLQILILYVVVLSADGFKVGLSIDELNSFKYQTPLGIKLDIPKRVDLIVVTFQKDTGALVNNFLDKKEASYLKNNGAIFIADIHTIPSLAREIFALPKFKRFEHLIYLNYGDRFIEYIPHQEDRVTLLHFDDSKLESISFVSTVAELEKSIEEK